MAHIMGKTSRLGDWPTTGVWAQVPASTTLQNAWLQLDTQDAWEDAGLDGALRYVRGSSHLCIPPEWRGYL